MMEDKALKGDVMSNAFPTPSEIVARLDKYVIGQSEAKKAVAIALRNRWRRQRVTDKIKDDIYPNNIILIGPTGVGKTEIARRLANIARAPFIKVEASRFTEVGYVGKDVESMIRDLVEISVNMVRREKTKMVQEKARTGYLARSYGSSAYPGRQRDRSAGGPGSVRRGQGQGVLLHPF